MIKAKDYPQDEITMRPEKESQAFRFKSQFIIEEKPYENFYKVVSKINPDINVRV